MNKTLTATDALKQLSKLKDFLIIIELRFSDDEKNLSKLENAQILLKKFSNNFISDLELGLVNLNLEPKNHSNFSINFTEIDKILRELCEMNINVILDKICSFFAEYDKNPSHFLKLENPKNLQETILFFNSERFT